MLHKFIAANRDLIVSRTRERVGSRPWPAVSSQELEFGVPLFLTQLSETLRLESTAAPFPDGVIAATAARHGAEALGVGLDVAQLVHDYGDICETITELAFEQAAPITVEEFHTLNRCLDIAVAEAVTAHTRAQDQVRRAEESERLGWAAHELRDTLNSALLAYQALKRGTVAINGSTGAVLGCSLLGIRDIIDRALTEVRLAAGPPRRERLTLATLFQDVTAAGRLHSEYRDVDFSFDPVDPELVVYGDPQLLKSAVMNLLQNAFKNTPPGGQVILRAHASADRLVVEVEDQCGGIPTSKGDLFRPFADRVGRDRSGLGLGLSIARAAVKAHGGDILVSNRPGTGCVFMIELPFTSRMTEHDAVGTRTG